MIGATLHKIQTVNTVHEYWRTGLGTHFEARQVVCLHAATLTLKRRVPYRSQITGKQQNIATV